MFPMFPMFTDGKRKFSTDNAAPCYGCQGTVVTYDVYEESSYVDVYCHGCGRRDVFDRGAIGCDTPAETSAAHRSTCPQGGTAHVQGWPRRGTAEVD